MTTINRDSVTSDIAERVRALAGERGVSTETLLAALNLPTGDALHILDGSEEMTLGELHRLSVALDVPITAMLEGLRGWA